MRWPGANLEEKHEPRGVSVAKAQNGDSMKSSGRNLTLAAIEKAVVALDNIACEPAIGGVRMAPGVSAAEPSGWRWR
jgi:hypothetical protein